MLCFAALISIISCLSATCQPLPLPLPLIILATPRHLSTEKLVKTARIKGADEAYRWTVEPMHVGVQNTQRDAHNVPHSMEPCE